MSVNMDRNRKCKTKKKNHRFLIASVLLLSVLLIPAGSAFAATPKIIYDGNQREVRFENIVGTDLFGGMKGIMPGDVREEVIQLKAKPAEREASFYLQAECDTETKEILKDVTMDLYAGDELVYADGLLMDSLKLGTLGKNEELPLRIVMSFPLTLGNEVAGKTFPIKWTITVQEDGKEMAQGIIPDKEDSHAAVTGDQSQVMGYVLMTVGALAVIIILIIYMRHRKK